MDESSQLVFILLLCVIVIMASLYSSVGHGGASGYIAAMALFGIAPETMKPAALIMNIFVASLVAARLGRSGYFNSKLFFPLATTSIPCALLGGMITLSSASYKALVGVALLLAAIKIFFVNDKAQAQLPHWWILALAGAILGFLAGLTGVGGGIYLSPLLLLFGWAAMRVNAAVVAVFILVNSIAGLTGHLLSGHSIPDNIAMFVIAAIAGALIGSELAVRRLAPERLQRLLGVVLVIAGIKMILTS